jgi:hypothetical protein
MQLRGTHRAGLRSYHPLSLRAAASSSSPSLLRPHPYRYNIRPRPRNKTLYRNIAPPVGDLPLSAPTLTLTPPRVYRRLPLDKALLRELGHEGVQVRDLLPAATHGRLLNLYRTNLCVGRGRVWGVECKAQSWVLPLSIRLLAWGLGFRAKVSPIHTERQADLGTCIHPSVQGLGSRVSGLDREDRVRRRGRRTLELPSTPRAAQSVSSIFFFFAFIMLGSVAYLFRVSGLGCENRVSGFGCRNRVSGRGCENRVSGLGCESSQSSSSPSKWRASCIPLRAWRLE